MVAQIAPIDLVAPGFLGLNLAQRGSVLPPAYATKAENAVIDSSGRLAARGGYTDLTTTDISGNPTIRSIWEFRQSNAAAKVILAWDGGISDDPADPSGSDISGSVTDTDGRWWFQNFNNKCIGFQDGQKPIVYTGTGSFATVVESSGTAPSPKGGVGLCAFGRVWGLDSDGKTIKYSGLLDETDWGGAGSGSIDMHNVWTDGSDQVKAIAAFNGMLVVFGTRHAVFWEDGTGSQLGLDPTNMVVTDVISGTGCITQWSVQHIGQADLVFLSRNGVQSLGRLIQERSNPVGNLSKYVRDDLIDSVMGSSDPDEISSAYSPEEGFYLLTVPDKAKTWVLDQRLRYRDREQDTVSIVTAWDLAPTAWAVKDDGDLYLGGTWGVGQYGQGATDDAGSTFRFSYQSPWLDLGEELADRLKMLKRIGSIVFVQNATTIVYKWGIDFDNSVQSLSKAVTSDSASEWGVAEWALGEFSGGLSLRIIKLPARGRGQYYRLALEADVSGQFAIQQLELFTKIGRLA